MGGGFAGSDLVDHMDADMDAHLVGDLCGHLYGRNRTSPPQNLKTPCIDRVSARHDLVGHLDGHLVGHLVGRTRDIEPIHASPHSPRSVGSPKNDQARMPPQDGGR